MADQQKNQAENSKSSNINALYGLLQLHGKDEIISMLFRTACPNITQRNHKATLHLKGLETCLVEGSKLRHHTSHRVCNRTTPAWGA
jgi:hypothetical protein